MGRGGAVGERDGGRGARRRPLASRPSWGLRTETGHFNWKRAPRVDGPAVLSAAPARRPRHHLAVRPLPRLVHGAHASGHRGRDDGRCGWRHQLVEAAAGHRHPAPPPSHRTLASRLCRTGLLVRAHSLRSIACLHPPRSRCSRRSPSSSSWSASTCRPSPATPSTRACEYARRRDRIDHRFLELNAVPPTLDEVPWPSPNPSPNPHRPHPA